MFGLRGPSGAQIARGSSGCVRINDLVSCSLDLRWPGRNRKYETRSNCMNCLFTFDEEFLLYKTESS